MTGLRGWGLPEQHLALDALVAFVDGELTPNAYDRAAAHLAGCPNCAAEATAQRQARSAMRTAEAPQMSSQLLQSLRSIPSEAELPAQPDGLALTKDGQLVTLESRGKPRPFGSGPTPGSSTPLGGGTRSFGGDLSFDRRTSATDHPEHPKGHGRRTKQGAGVVFSGIVLGALAFINVPGDEPRDAVTTVPRPFPRNDTARTSNLVPTGTAIDGPLLRKGHAPEHSVVTSARSSAPSAEQPPPASSSSAATSTPISAAR
ncbi:hypothetical protein FHX42_000276 [Saccharopolyspora lacisalsi]|uniref:Putative zinc-finger domain-containing protein n=1 Tax=Halosaccharopolyspora lacisalsi TaxID=1000566 RepID=A0A839DU73_9PSEU|nr:zf-HC2 domain-containing protein [Halosaccharopolyspora lacisalsi]MBA8822947.1 hypothetical protein [Halosaccharopolyspora lacisalsi]